VSEDSYIEPFRNGRCVDRGFQTFTDGESIMGNVQGGGGKVQGEGDYESARRYNKETREFVDKEGEAATHGPGGGMDEAAEKEALSRAREGKQDKRDAKVMKEDPQRK
jgi:hypothetical protein